MGDNVRERVLYDSGGAAVSTREPLTLEELQDALKHFQRNTDVFFLVTMGTICFFLQCGFAFLEAGAVRSKNTTNILIKNMLDVFIGGISYWLVGFPLAFGEGNSFCGTTYWASYELPDERLAFWFFQFVFAATAATIVSGSMAERCAFNAYLIYSIVLTVVYPVVSHWAWSDSGWLSVRAYQDFAGSGVVHLTGGVAALMGAIILGPRAGRFGSKGMDLRGHSVPLAALGGFILLFGFLAFNGGSQASISQEGDASAVAKAIVNTVLSGSAGGITVLLVYRSGACGRPSTWSFLMALNGALTGMVSICAGCNVVWPWGAVVIGSIAGMIFLGIHILLPMVKVDDPLDAVAVHMGGGFWGLIAVSLFKDGGIVYGGSTEVLAWNLAGAMAILGWSGGLSSLMFGTLRLLGMLRVPPEMELQGLDILKHGEPAYPAEAWIEDQYSSSITTENGVNRNIYLPPNMSSFWHPSWANYLNPGQPMYWTLPDPRRARIGPGSRPHPQTPASPKMNDLFYSDKGPNISPASRPRHHESDEARDHRSLRGHMTKAYSNEGFEVEVSKF
ncbi:putative ammonium transporter 1 isoform X2 [Homarus americanus]|uniref:putative ammonium transporter 1 isoform X2 n=1 Tax=Homarus americanus TaxID=6706 RepID=UPI001C462CF1|nr:putative ammonium transporter 1 isoform X2 [Homarus americanus]